MIDHKGLTWDAYVLLLHALAVAGITDQSYVAASISREQSLLRMPGVPKPPVRPSPVLDPDEEEAF